METIAKKAWHPLPPLELSSPIFALATGKDGIWASGTGGIAWYGDHAPDNGQIPEGTHSHTWETRIATLPLSSVTTLIYKDDLLLAGGLEGIATSEDGGLHWGRASLEDNFASISALAASPHFSQDGTVVAGTLTNGILRTEDSGQTWVSASFGLESFEVTALAWTFGSVLLAATSDGIYRSSDAGRAWRRVYESDELVIDTLVYLSEQEVLAALDSGGMLRSLDGGAHWSLDDGALQDVHILSLFVEGAENRDASDAPKTIFAGTLEHGLVRSTAGEAIWEEVYHDTVISLAAGNSCLYAGTDSGVSRSNDGGRTWHELPCPPVHDLTRLQIYEKQPLLMGPYAGLVYYTGSDWKILPDLPQALTSTTIAPDGSLLVSSLDGLMRLALNEGEEPQMLVEGQDGQIGVITFRRNDSGWQAWGASNNGTRLLRSDDEGKTWRTLRGPFGVLPVVALQVIPDRIVAATYDPRQHNICVWSSTDDGENWERGVVAETSWPVVATSDDPPLITMVNRMLVQNDAGKWHEVRVGEDEGMIRRVVTAHQNANDAQNAPATEEEEAAPSAPTSLFVLTTTGIQRSDDWGANWRLDNEGVPVEQIIDIATDDTDLYVFLTGGRVWRRAL